MFSSAGSDELGSHGFGDATVPSAQNRAPGPIRVLCLRRRYITKKAGRLTASNRGAGHGFRRAGYRAEPRVHACDGRVVSSCFSHGHALHRGLLVGSSGSLDCGAAGILGPTHSQTLVAGKALGEKTKWSDFDLGSRAAVLFSQSGSGRAFRNGSSVFDGSCSWLRWFSRAP